jgi:hypothetical protein
MDMKNFTKNRLQFPVEELLKYAGMYIAWSPDGRSIVASDTNLLRLDKAIRAAGYDPSETLVSSMPEDDVILGGGVIE